MIGYISIGYYDTREQEIFSSPSVLVKLVRMAMRTAVGCGVTPVGYLTRTAISGMFPEELQLESLHLAKGPRRASEIETLAKAVRCGIGEEPEWLIVFRPGQGWMSERRVRQFIHSLEEVDGEFAVSVRRMPTIANPSWNVNVADRRFLVNGTVRLPVHGGHFHTSLDEAENGFWFRMGCDAVHHRSQDVGSLYIDDGLLYAVRTEALRSTGNAFSESPCPIHFDQEDDACMPVYERLGIFDVDKDQFLNTEILERILPADGDGE